MSNVKKVILFLFLIFVFFVSSVFAVDINVRPNNIASNFEATDNNNQTNNSSNLNIIRSNETTTNTTSPAPTVSTSTTSSRSQNNKLTVSDIIDIIVASIGIVNLLLGIAILIRFK